MPDEPPSDSRVTAVIVGLLIERVEALEAKVALGIHYVPDEEAAALRVIEGQLAVNLAERLDTVEKCLADIETRLNLRRKDQPKPLPPPVVEDDKPRRRWPWQRDHDEDGWLV